MGSSSRGTEGSNPPPSTGESANPRSLETLVADREGTGEHIKKVAVVG
jgi:hypothetical protein